MSIFGVSASRPTIRGCLSTFCWRQSVRHPRAAFLPTNVLVGNVRANSSATGMSWESLGISTCISNRLKEEYPHIAGPTSAQQALLLALFRGHRRDVFLRDYMGRGKTFAMALAGVQLAQTERVLVLAPSQQLVEQINTHVHNLAGRAPVAQLTITTPQLANKDGARLDKQYGTVMMDEPETMLAPLPPRNLPAGALKLHPFTRHSPPLASLLDRLQSRPRTVWIGAEINSLLKRVVRQRGWASMDALELDFGTGPSARGVRDVEAILGSVSPATPFFSTSTSSVKHTSLFVDEVTGAVTVNEDSAGTAMPPYRTGRPVIEQSILDAIIVYETQRPMHAGQAALVLPPEGYPLDLLAVQLSETSSPSSTTGLGSGSRLQCSILGFDDQAIPDARMLIAPRSAVPGLDIPRLCRVYLINGLDLAGISPAQRARGGLKRRRAFYEVVTGRLGRLGSVTATGQEKGEVISLVVRGSGEELGLQQRQLS